MDNKISIYTCEQGSEAWHDLRCGRITASKFKSMMSKTTTKGYQDIVFNTVGEIISGETEPTYTNDAMQRGIDLEPEARLFYEEINDVVVEEVGFITNDNYWPEFIGISPDGIMRYDRGIIEIKCPKMNTHIGYLKNGKMPNEYKWQVQGQLLITGADYCDFMSYYPGIKPFILRVEPDKKMQEELAERMRETISKITELKHQIERL